MIIKIGQYYFFYRHMLYGSALVIGNIIGTQGYLNHILSYIFLGVGTMLMINSVFVSYVVNKFPEEFEKEMNKHRDEQSSQNL